MTNGDIGVNLREIRTQRGLSLRQLAQETGLSPALLSQVERGLNEPSLKTLRALSSVLGDSSRSLFSTTSPIPLRTSRPGERSRISSPIGRLQYERITPNNGVLEVLRGTLPPGGWSSDEGWSHESVECIYVECGPVVVEVDKEAFILETGEALTFEATRPHRYGNGGDSVVHFLITVSPPIP